jgi:CRISPR-associated endonuclease/helicase Cas3
LKLAKQTVKRKVDIIECQDELGKEKNVYFSKIKDALIQKHHNHHTIDMKSNKKISFGVVRMANIQPCVSLSKYLIQEEYPANIEVRVMAYHSNQVLLLRHEQEKHLDEVLKRKEKKGEEAEAFRNEIIRTHVDGCDVENIIFILVATPVEEVGRDHDFDWAVVEPSSFRSIIQLAGRVKRHREGGVKKANIALMQYNLKSFTINDDAIKSFQRPGYETELTLKTHNISKLINIQQIEQCLDATQRILKPNKLNEKGSLSHLEHYMTEQDLTDYAGEGADTFQGYLEGSSFMTAHPQYFHPFRKSSPTLKTFLTYDKSQDRYIFTEYDKFGKLIVDIFGNPLDRGEVLRIKYDNSENLFNSRIWLKRDYNLFIEAYAKKRELSKKEVSLKFGELSFNTYEGSHYEYSDEFGLVKV